MSATSYLTNWAGVCTAALCLSAGAKEPVDCVNTEIGTISHLLVPCFRTVQLPNSMLRFLPPHRDFTVDRVGPLRLQNPAHRSGGVFRCHPYSGAERVPPKDWEKATLGGKPLVGTVLPHAAILSGQTLKLEMHE